MRFLSIAYRSFGPFENVRLDFSNSSRGLHLLYGPNEAGKSSALRGLRALLFGFPHETPDNFRYQYKQFRIEAELLASGGRKLHCVRRKQASKTLYDATDRAGIREEELTSLLAGLDEAQFNTLFGLDHDQLVNGGRDILAGRGSLGEALFAAGAGLTGLRRIDAALLARQHEHYKPRARQLRIPIAIEELSKCQASVRQNALPLEHYTEKHQEWALAKNQLAEAEKELASIRSEREKLAAIDAALPLIEPWQQAKLSRDLLGSPPLLAADFESVFQAAVSQLAATQREVDLGQTQVESLGRGLSEATNPGPILTESLTIERLKRDLGAYLKAIDDRRALMGRQHAHESSIRNIIRSYFPHKKEEEAPALLVDGASRDRIDRLAKQLEAVLQDSEQADSRVSKLREEYEHTQEQLRQLPPPDDHRSLSSLLEQAQREAMLEQLQEEEMRLLAEAKRATEIALGRLAPWRGKPERAEALPVPSVDVIRKHEQLLSEGEQEIRGSEHELEIAQREKARLDLELARLEQASAIPSEAELGAERGERDSAWQRLKEHLHAGRYQDSLPLLESYEQRVVRADIIADRLRHEADRVQQAAYLMVERQALAKRTQEIEEKLKHSADRAARVRKGWEALWGPVGIDARLPVEMLQWHQAWLEATKRIGDARKLQESVERRQLQIDSWIQKLREILNENGTLHALLQLGMKRLRASQELESQRAHLKGELTRLRSALRVEEKHLEKATTRLSEWHAQWAEAIAVLSLKPDADPETADIHLQQLTQLERELGKLREVQARIAGIDRDSSIFHESLISIRNRLGIDTSVTESQLQSAVDDLDARLILARQHKAERDSLETQLENAQRGLEDARKKLIGLEAKLRLLSDQAGVAGTDEIPRAIQRARQRDAIEQTLRGYEASLRQQARGTPLLDFIALAQSNAAEISTRIEALKDRESQLIDRLREQERIAQSAEDQLRAWREGEAKAIMAAQDTQLALTTLRRHLREFATIVLARNVLLTAMRSFRQKHQARLLEQASSYFSQLTCGSFHRLDVVESEKGDAVLVGIRGISEEVPVEGMSEGTRDQLFLALRLSGIEMHLEGREPVPLIVDDIMVNFDDKRAIATFHCLERLSSRTQILFFTHHEHLVNLALESLPGTAFRHDMG